MRNEFEIEIRLHKEQMLPSPITIQRDLQGSKIQFVGIYIPSPLSEGLNRFFGLWQPCLAIQYPTNVRTADKFEPRIIRVTQVAPFTDGSVGTGSFRRSRKGRKLPPTIAISPPKIASGGADPIYPVPS